MTDATKKMLDDLKQARDTMIDTLDMMTQRGMRLEQLTTRASDLSSYSKQFSDRVYERTSNRRMRLFLGAVLLVFLFSMGIYFFLIFDASKTKTEKK